MRPSLWLGGVLGWLAAGRPGPAGAQRSTQAAAPVNAWIAAIFRLTTGLPKQQR